MESRIPRGLIAGIVRSHAAVCPWLNCNVINNELRRRKYKGIFYVSAAAINDTTGVTDNALAIVEDDMKGGRPEGSTDKKGNMMSVQYCLQNIK